MIVYILETIMIDLLNKIKLVLYQEYGKLRRELFVIYDLESKKKNQRQYLESRLS